MHDPSEEPTLAVCIRCAQHFPARRSCPFCSDLRLVIREDSELEGRGRWRFELWQGPARMMMLGGFTVLSEAQARGHEFLRHYVAERIAAASVS